MLLTDAGDIAISASLNQSVKPERDDQVIQSLALFLAKLSPSQQKWSVFDCELHDIYAVIKHFRYMLKERTFSLLTDH